MVTMPNECEPLRIHIPASKQQVSAAPQIDDCLHHIGDLLLVQRFIICHVTRPRDWSVRQERDHVCACQGDRFIKKFFPDFA